MKRRSALLIAGIVTAFVMVIVVGLVLLSNRAAQVAQAAAADVPSVQAPDPATITDVPTLQAELKAYQQALGKAHSDLQTAYNQIQTLDGQVSQLTQSVQQLQDGQSGFSSGRRARGSDSARAPFFGGHDD